MIDAFDLADLYRIPVIMLGDGALGQMTEALTLPEPSNRKLPPKDYVLDGCKGREPRTIKSLRLSPQGALEELNLRLKVKYEEIIKKEQRYDTYEIEDAEIIIVSFGMASRIAKVCVRQARERGIKVGLLRPIALWPFPENYISELASRDSVKAFIDVEMNLGQMVEDVRRVVKGRKEVFFYGRTAGMLPEEEELLQIIVDVSGG
jgi:2-oxoglutarate ferredoxin oxidoreductase subunit alpha